jgi:hypothetical protein
MQVQRRQKHRAGPMWMTGDRTPPVTYEEQAINSSQSSIEGQGLQTVKKLAG